MIQFNLLPDVKLQYIKAQRLKRLISVVATLVTATALAIVVLLYLYANVIQSKHLSDLNSDIKTNTSKLENTPNLTKILTVQSQLQSLPALHAKKPISSRFLDYLTQLTPAQVTISSTTIDFTANTITVTGGADALANVNTFVDTLKFSNYQKQGDTTQTPAFSQVVMTSFTRDAKAASYTINLSFDPVIFDGSTKVTLIVPNQVTTRSETEKPESLFQSSNTPTTKAGK